MVDERPLAIAARLQTATDAITIGVAVCELTRARGIEQCGVAFYEADGRPSLLVDNARDTSDAHRMTYAQELWLADPYLRLLRQHHAPVDDDAITRSQRWTRARYPAVIPHTVMLPIVAPSHLLGSIKCGSSDRFVDTTTRWMTTLAHYVSVRGAELGLAVAPDPAIARLTRRQLDVAQLIAHGKTNAQIGEHLGLSENTVKKHLKDIYATLDVGNRTECAARLRHDAPRRSLSVGVTHLGEVAITYAGG